MNSKLIEKKLRDAFPGCDVKANDLTGGGDHWSVTISASEFVGISMIQQHRLVYEALGDWMKKEIHALALNTSGKK